MSGLEAIAAIASIVALIEFSQKVLIRAAKLRAGGKDIGYAFQCINDLLAPITHAVKRTKERIDNKEIDEETCTALLPIHRGVERTLEELSDILRKYTPEDGASKVEVLWKTGKGVFQEKKVKGVLQRLHEYVSVLTLFHDEATSAQNFSSSEKENIRQILATVARSNTTQAASSPRKCRNLLSLDGGGLRGLSKLYILRDLMAKVNEHQDPPLKPCEVFDLIGGSGTGGLIAIMLGRLGMTVDECLDEYLELFERLAAEPSENTRADTSSTTIIKSGILRATVLELVQSRGLPSEGIFRNENNVSCYTARSTTATIVDAACATLSSAKVFEPVQFGRPPSKYVAGDLGANNPIDRVWNEAQRIWGKSGGLEQSISCIISVGAGSPRSRPIHTNDSGFASAMYDIAIETEETAKKFNLAHSILGAKDKRYHRFNVNSLPELGWDGFGESGMIMELANDYLEGCWQEVERCAENLQRENFAASNTVTVHCLISAQFKAISKRSTLEAKPITFLPFDQSDSLVNRDDVFEAIDELLTLQSQSRSIALWGLGGCGKTQIALEYAYRRQNITSCSVFWIHADSVERFTQDYTNLAKIASLPPDLKGEDLLIAVKQWIERQTNWVLILDNADDLKLFKKPYSATLEQQLYTPDLLQFVPRTQTESILWTSRDGSILGSLVGVQRGIEVGPMTDQEAWELLSNARGRTDVSQPSEEERELLELLEKLPLAIAQAGAFMRMTKVSIQQYLEFFNESESRQSKLLSYEFQDTHRLEVPNSVMRTWLISMDQIAKESVYSATILNTIVFFDNKGIPFELVKAAVGLNLSEEEVLLAAGRLTEYSFLQVQKATNKQLPTYDQHRLVNLATRQVLTETQARSFSSKALQIMDSLFPSGKFETWESCISYLPHTIKALSLQDSQDYNGQIPSLLQRVGMYYWEQGRSDEAERLELEVLKLRKEVVGAKHLDTIRAMANHMEMERQFTLNNTDTRPLSLVIAPSNNSGPT